MAGAASEYAQALLGGAVAETDKTVSVGSTKTQLLKNNPERVLIMFVNNGTDDVYIKPNDTVSNGDGILLVSGGGSASLNLRDDTVLCTRDWYAITAAGTSSVYVLSMSRFTSLGKPSALSSPLAG